MQPAFLIFYFLFLILYEDQSFGINEHDCHYVMHMAPLLPSHPLQDLSNDRRVRTGRHRRRPSGTT
jgi:hypothetical protein